MPQPTTYHFTLPKSKCPHEIVLNEPWYPGVQAYWSNCTTTRVQRQLELRGNDN